MPCTVPQDGARTRLPASSEGRRSAFRIGKGDADVVLFILNQERGEQCQAQPK